MFLKKGLNRLKFRIWWKYEKSSPHSMYFDFEAFYLSKTISFIKQCMIFNLPSVIYPLVYTFLIYHLFQVKIFGNNINCLRFMEGLFQDNLLLDIESDGQDS